MTTLATLISGIVGSHSTQLPKIAMQVPALFSLIVSTAAKRLGLVPTFTHLDSTSFHVDGRYNSDEEPEEHVIHITRGYSRDRRLDLNQVMLDLIVEHQAGIPVLMKPLSGNSSDAHDFGQVITDPGTHDP